MTTTEEITLINSIASFNENINKYTNRIKLRGKVAKFITKHRKAMNIISLLFIGFILGKIL